MSAVTNPAAFARPASVGVDNWQHSEQDGMALRDWFAGQALGSCIECHQRGFIAGQGPAEIADTAYAIADAMLAQRARGAKP